MFINVKSSMHYFYMKTKILADFQICISVPSKIEILNENDVLTTTKTFNNPGKLQQ